MRLLSAKHKSFLEEIHTLKLFLQVVLPKGCTFFKIYIKEIKSMETEPLVWFLIPRSNKKYLCQQKTFNLFIFLLINKFIRKILFIILMSSSILTITTEQTGQGFIVAQFKSSELAIFSYYIQSQHECVLIDPVFNVQTYTSYIKERKSVLKYVMLTHYHADYLSGHTQFKVPIVMGPSAVRQINTFKVKECTDNQVLSLGNIKLKIIHTPGHTIQSSCFQLIDAANKDIALFSGDTVFLGEVGRPDLACSQKITSDDLASMLYDSVQKIKKLGGNMRLYPGHGSGSACGKSIGAGNYCTVGAQNSNNYGFKFQSKEEFVKAMTANLPRPPIYFFHDAGLNQKGPSSYDLSLKNAHIPLTTAQFLKLKQVTKVVDTRNDLGQGLIKGSYWLPNNGPIVNFISNFISPEQAFVIITEKTKQLDIINRFFRIGYFNIKGYANFDISELKEDFVRPSIIKFQDLKNLNENRQHVDVRSRPEYQTTGVVQKAILIPLPQLQSRVQELRNYENIVVNCLSGMRSKVAWSILTKHSISAKVLAEDFKLFKNQGFNIVEYKS